MNFLKEGDIISWTVDNDHPIFKDKIFSAEIAMVNEDEKVYGVYASYGQDLIPFSQALKPENLN